MDAKKSWKGMGNGTRIAIGAIILVVIVLIICLIMRAMRNKKRLAAASDSSHSRSSSESPVQHPHGHPLHDHKHHHEAPRAAAPAPTVAPKVETAQPQPTRVVGSAGFVQKTCGDDINCTEPKLSERIVQHPRSNVRSTRAVVPPKQKVQQHVQEHVQEANEHIAAQEQSRVEAATHYPVQQPSQEATAKPSRFTVKNDDE